MRKIFGVIYDNKLFLVMMMILLSYVGTIHSDYIVQDAFVEQSGEYVPVTEKMPVRTEISPTKNQGGVVSAAGPDKAIGALRYL